MKRLDRYDLLLGRPDPVEGRASWHIGLEPVEHGGAWDCPRCELPVADSNQRRDVVHAKLRGHWLRTHAWGPDYWCPDCNIARNITKLKSGCPKCRETMIPVEAAADW